MALTKVSTPAIKDEAITLAKLLHGDSNSNGKFLRANNGADPTFETIDLTALSASNLTSGTLPDARFPATLPAISGANLTNLDASDLASGTIPDARFPATLPAVSGANLTGINTDLVSDGSPQLGAALDTNGYNINFGDSTGNGNAVNRLTFGTKTHGDLQIYHDGNNSYIIDRGTGELRLYAAETLRIRDTDSGEEMITCNKNGSVDLYYNNEKKLFTHGGGTDLQTEGSTCEMKLRTDGGTIRGWLYANNSNQVGLLDEGGNWAIMHYNDNYTQFRINNVVKARIDGDGLKFGNDTAAANAISDYEEGSWTATCVSGGSSFTNDSTNNRYVKIGSMVYITGEVYSLVNPSNNTFEVGGLPYQIAQSREGTGSIMTHHVTYGSGRTMATIYVYASQSKFRIYTSGNATSWRAITGSDFSVSGDIIFSFAYHTV